MTYENFIKLYYRLVSTRIDSVKEYFGTINNFDKFPIFITESNKYSHLKKSQPSSFMSGFEINIDAPINVYEDYFDYYDAKYEDLGILFSGTKILKIIFDGLKDLDDETINLIVENLINSALAKLEDSGVISYGDSSI